MATSVKFYFDEHMPRKVERGILERGIEVIMAVDVGMVRVLTKFATEYTAESAVGQVFWLR